jgi:cell fate (sporulation/competence/biofilm development) regulator YmcA (YheA/YmcA/DUF963 family)
MEAAMDEAYRRFPGDDVASGGQRYAFAEGARRSEQRIAELEAALRKINALIDSPARFNKEVQDVLDSVIDTSDTKFSQ